MSLTFIYSLENNTELFAILSSIHHILTTHSIWRENINKNYIFIKQYPSISEILKVLRILIEFNKYWNPFIFILNSKNSRNVSIYFSTLEKFFKIAITLNQKVYANSVCYVH